MSHVNFICELTIIIPLLPWLFSVADEVSWTVEQFNSVPTDYVNWFNFMMLTFDSNWFPIELLPWCDGWQRTWWQMIHMMPGLPFSSIPQCQYNLLKGVCVEVFQVVGSFEPTLTEAHPASIMICKVRSFKSQIQTHSYVEDIIPFSSKVL